MAFHWPWWPPPWVKHHHKHHHHPHHHVRPVLIVGDVAFDLIPEEIVHMATTLNVGQSVALTIAYLDQQGQPMTTTPTPDAPPVWTNGGSSIDALVVAPDGNSATDTGVSGGADTISLSLAVGGVSFAAQLAITVTPPAQVLTSIEIVPGAPTP